MDGHIAPAEQTAPVGPRDVFDRVLDRSAVREVAREEDHADAVLACLRKRDVRLDASGAKEGVGDLEEDARAVAGFGVTAYGAAMLEVLEEQERAAHDVMRPRAPQMRDESHAAPVVLVGRVVQSLRGG